ncbi:uncharacterized protein Z519_05848 [Cladophialophora bantiana CBS 173.52]|uniref:Methyltransferase type 11 domain-containing protein n=1 Tax=Cladophialophora bantiana (strain ATCC 10958 / CBS 173.52 / CDC B-1940 / NIH 8579) TaxID=1442370 RepID=A0A0D2HIX7_CLAB1|nr:uncharacterized protein Z519_05848 [Cladophialophora bantiana CBS 173.52]KIW93243.1 hypothetical protein Z519_05848 [Cladophialophora bantiana CBS 173.52]
MPWPPLQERLLNLLDPGYLLWSSACAFVTTAFQFYVLQLHLPSASNFKNVRDDAFSKFWTKVTEPVDPPPPPKGSATLVPPLLSRAHGVVLDIGPGSGSYVSLFADNPNISAVYGAEPTPGLHVPLQQRINEAKLTDKYHILSCTADKAEVLAALAKEGVRPSAKGIFDTIVCVRVLCSVPNLAQTASELYSLLRPGGELMIVEHIRNPWTKNGSILGRAMQLLYHLLGWPFFLAGCNMDRDTPAVLKSAAPWEAVDLKTHFEWTALPYVAGTLTKRR